MYYKAFIINVTVIVISTKLKNHSNESRRHDEHSQQIIAQIIAAIDHQLSGVFFSISNKTME
jgi:hypothetical protein